jgi:quercetin dioxygenase-like cupin family protein
MLAAFVLAQGPRTHIALTSAEIKWGPAPPSLQKGAEVAVVSGNPAAAEPFVIRLRVPAGYVIAPHWHPTDEHVTVISGTFGLGMGEKFDKAALKEMPAGSYGMLPAEMRHFAMAKTAAIVQVHGMGPFVVNYVNPADDPSKASSHK